MVADWTRIPNRGNVEDRRSFGPASIGGGIGLAGLALTLLFNYLSTGEVRVDDLLRTIDQSQVLTSQPLNTADFEGNDTYEVFASTVLGSTNEMWTGIFAVQNVTYEAPKLVLFRVATESACGGADSRMGPHYCPNDKTIYLDETFFDELRKLGGTGDVAQVYVLAHEVGHHVQNSLGTLQPNSSREDSIATELEADCYAGMWANSIRNLGVMEPGEIREAMDAAAAVGDDRVQSTFGGRVTPESWTHGSSEARVSAFNRGYESSSLSSCDG